ncbi:MOSC domain-containing protein [Nocardioides nanhaiensis]
MLSEIWRYPVKSMRGHQLTEATVEPWGLAGDRRWMVTDADGSFLTARELPRLLLGVPTPGADNGLRLHADGLGDLVVPAPGADARERTVQIWSSSVRARDAGDDAAAWVAELVGADVRLVWLADPTQRPPNPAFARTDDRVSLADGYPLLVTTEASLEALGGGFSMRRFRPNLVVTGSKAWAEDDWRVVRVGGPGGAVFRAVKGCPRCVMTTRDPDTAEGGREPVTTLARLRRFDGATWFGTNLVPDTPGAVVREGDVVEVLEEVEPGAGPLR